MISIGLKELLEAGVHFGHQTRRWNPKMKPFIFDARNGIHIIDLSKSLAQLEAACEFLSKTVTKGGKVLFVGTKKQAQQAVKETAKDCGQYFVTERWLGGTLTNFQTVNRLPTQKPSDSGQYGFNLKYFAPDFNNGTEFGLFFLNYHSRLPLISGQTGSQ